MTDVSKQQLSLNVTVFNHSDDGKLFLSKYYNGSKSTGSDNAISIFTKSIQIKNMNITLSIWDITPSKSFLFKTVQNNAQAILFTFDITRSKYETK